jgi:hypothetical protein
VTNSRLGIVRRTRRDRRVDRADQILIIVAGIGAVDEIANSCP